MTTQTKLGAAIGGSTGLGLHIDTLFANITLLASLETLYYACIGATAGLLITFFGKLILDKLFKK